jgi:hypothetical protein
MTAAARHGPFGPAPVFSTTDMEASRHAEEPPPPEHRHSSIWRETMATSRRGVVALGMAGVFVLSAAVLAAAQGTTPQANPPQQAQVQEDTGGGFVIGFGAGWGSTNWKEEAYYLPNDYSYYYYGVHHSDIPTSHSGLTTNFKIGGAINNRFLILFHSTATFFDTETEGTVVDAMATGDLQVHVVGRKGRSFYVFGGAGYHNVMHFDFNDPYSGSNSIGFGVRGGAGVEIVKYLAIEFHVQHGFNENEHNPTAWAVTFNFLKR